MLIMTMIVVINLLKVKFEFNYALSIPKSKWKLCDKPCFYVHYREKSLPSYGRPLKEQAFLLMSCVVCLIRLYQLPL